jgi:CheY-like chemotaxis protein
MKGDREICLEAGMDNYGPKPVHEDDLRAVLDGRQR